MKIQNIFNKGRFIYTFERLDDGALSIKEDKEFWPYYFEPSNDGSYISYDNRRLKKVLASDPYEIGKNRSPSSYESDIIYTKRYLIDKVATIEKGLVKYFFVDIEIHCKDFPDIHKALDPISCITIYNSVDNQLYTWFLPEWPNEELMLEDFVNYVKDEAPDLFMAWNVEFDYTYLHNRIKDFPARISPIGMTRMGKDKTYFPAGISVVDYKGLFEKITLNKRRSYALDYIAQEDLGEQPWKVTKFGVVDQDVKDKNINDILRMMKLEEKFKAIPQFDEMRRFAKCLWEDLPQEHIRREGRLTTVSNNSKIIDQIVLQEARLKNIILPKKSPDSEKEEFEGAFRESYKTGVFTDLGKYDLSGAYLYAITDLCLDTSNIVEDQINNTVVVNITDRLSGNVSKTYYVTQNEDALLPTVIRKLVTERNKYRKLAKENPDDEMIDLKYKAMKTIVLSCWGVMGNQYFRLYDNRIASMITSAIRDLLHYVKSELEKLGYEVIYIDTDSFFILDKGKDISKLLNEIIQTWSQNRFGKPSSIRFDYEGHFKSILILSKCHYYGYLEGKAKPEIKGVEVKKSSSSKYEAGFQDSLINKVLKGAKKGAVVEWIEQEIDAIKNLPIQQVSFPCKIMNDNYVNVPIFVRAYNNSRELFKDSFNPNKGELFYYVFVKPLGEDKNGKPRDVIAFLPEPDLSKYSFGKVVKIDYDEVIRRNIRTKAETIFEVMGWGTLDDGLNGQTSLW